MERECYLTIIGAGSHWSQRAGWRSSTNAHLPRVLAETKLHLAAFILPKCRFPWGTASDGRETPPRGGWWEGQDSEVPSYCALAVLGGRGSYSHYTGMEELNLG